MYFPESQHHPTRARKSDSKSSESGAVQMRISEILEKLFDIERSIAVETNATILNKIIELEEDVLSMQWEKAETLHTVSKSFDFNTQSTSVVFTSASR
jgi:hypothetical protein